MLAQRTVAIQTRYPCHLVWLLGTLELCFQKLEWTDGVEELVW